MSELHKSTESTFSERYARATAAYYGKDVDTNRTVPVPMDIEAAEQIAYVADAELRKFKHGSIPSVVETHLFEQAVKVVESFHAMSVDAADEFDAHAQQTDAFKDAHQPLLFSQDYDPDEYNPLAIKNAKDTKAVNDTFNEIVKNY